MGGKFKYCEWGTLHCWEGHSSRSVGDGRSCRRKMASRVIGVCAMEKKALSPQMQQLVEWMKRKFDVEVFPQKMIVDDPVETWPAVDFLIAFYSDGFPLNKAQEYVRLRRPRVINDLDKQWDLMDRTKVYETLRSVKVDIPDHVVVWRDNKHKPTSVIEEKDQIIVDGHEFKKPFVEKPVSAEDHNIIIYYPTSMGGGCRHLFRKSHDRCSEYSKENSNIRQNGSYVYEELIQANGIDVKVYAVGPDHAYAEARKAPSIEGKVQRNAQGKEIRQPVRLRPDEMQIARKVVQAFGQTVCGFDLLRTGRKSYVCDVNGFSFVKASQVYYKQTALILQDIIEQKVPTIPWLSSAEERLEKTTTTGARMELRCVLAVIRHGDRTPKQKLKFVTDHAKWAELYKANKSPGKTEIKLKKPEQLQAALNMIRTLVEEERERQNPNGELVSKLKQAQTVLEMHGGFSGINRKIQLKRRPGSSSKFQVVVKWGGELTPAGVMQAEAMGNHFRSLYPGEKGDSSRSGFLRLHNTYRHDLKVYSSDEGRVQTTAAAFTKGLLAMDAELAAMLVHMIKSADTDGLLDDDTDSLQYKENVMARLTNLFQLNRGFEEKDMMELNPSRMEALDKALRDVGNPKVCCDKICSLMEEMCAEIDRRCKDPTRNGVKLYEGETWDLVSNRWRKLVNEFRVTDDDGEYHYEILKIRDCYDNIKYDLEHNLQHFRKPGLDELYRKVKMLADVVVTQEYGIGNDEKLAIGRGTCTPLMRKLLGDLKACVTPGEGDDGNATSLDSSASVGIESPGRRVRTRLYFTSKSHLHSLVNVLRYGGLFEAEEDQWKRSSEFLSKVWEYNFLAQVVILLYEDTSKEKTAADRFHIELHFSPGALPYEGVEQLDKLTKPIVDKERLISTGVIDEKAQEYMVNPPLWTTAVIGGTSNEPSLWTYGAQSRDLQNVTCYVPPVRTLATLSNRLSCKVLMDFLDRMIIWR